MPYWLNRFFANSPSSIRSFTVTEALRSTRWKSPFSSDPAKSTGALDR
jgi:hypothetical protein